MLNTLKIIIMGVAEFFAENIMELLGYIPMLETPPINIFNALAAALENYLSSFWAQIIL